MNATETDINLFLAQNGAACYVRETGSGLDLYHAGSLWIRDIPRDTSPVTLLSAIKAAPQPGAQLPDNGCCQSPSLGRQFLEAGVWGAGLTGGSVLMGGLMGAAIDIFLGGGSRDS